MPTKYIPGIGFVTSYADVDLSLTAKSAAHQRPMVKAEAPFGEVSEGEATPPQMDDVEGGEDSNTTDPIDSSDAEERMDTAPEPEDAELVDSEDQMSNAGWDDTEDEDLVAAEDGHEKSWVGHRNALFNTVTKSLRGLSPAQKSARLIGLRKAVAIVTMAMPPAEEGTQEEESQETPAEESQEQAMGQGDQMAKKPTKAPTAPPPAAKARVRKADAAMPASEGTEVAAEDENTPAVDGNIKSRARVIKSGARVYVPKLKSTGVVLKSIIKDGVTKHHVRADVDNKVYACRAADVMPTR